MKTSRVSSTKHCGTNRNWRDWQEISSYRSFRVRLLEANVLKNVYRVRNTTIVSHDADFWKSKLSSKVVLYLIIWSDICLFDLIKYRNFELKLIYVNKFCIESIYFLHLQLLILFFWLVCNILLWACIFFFSERILILELCILGMFHD